MAYYRDLTKYRYDETPELQKTLNVGWLSRWHRFPTGSAAPEFVEQLLALCIGPMSVCHRGFHSCDICSTRDRYTKVMVDGEEYGLGYGIFPVNGKNARAYAVPSLVYHYVTEHGYLPPAEFVEAVMAQPEADNHGMQQTSC